MRSDHNHPRAIEKLRKDSEAAFRSRSERRFEVIGNGITRWKQTHGRLGQERAALFGQRLAPFGGVHTHEHRTVMCLEQLRNQLCIGAARQAPKQSTLRPRGTPLLETRKAPSRPEIAIVFNTHDYSSTDLRESASASVHRGRCSLVSEHVQCAHTLHHRRYLSVGTGRRPESPPATSCQNEWKSEKLNRRASWREGVSTPGRIRTFDSRLKRAILYR